MILRKPYAFLIKHFKLIHLILAVIFAYTAFRAYEIEKFIRYYQSEGWVQGFNFTADTYIDATIFLAIGLAVIILATVLLLMKKKEKPILYYIINIITYLVIFLLFAISYAILVSMETKTLDTRIVNLIADFNLSSFIIQFVMFILALVRGLGFDIKKFNFGEDIEDLKIEMADNEEVEVAMKVDTDNIFTTLRHNNREIKYFYQENSFFINILGTLALMFITLALYLNFAVYNKIYKENEVFRAGFFNIALIDTYVTKYDYRERIITADTHSYVVIKLKITNITKDEHSFNIDRYRLIAGSSIYKPVVNHYNQLFDIGFGYKNEIITGNTTKEYILTYLVDNRSLRNQLVIRYKNSINFSPTKFSANYRRVKTTANDLDDEEKTMATVKLKTQLNFEKSLLKKSTFKINNYEISDQFSYTFKNCADQKCPGNEYYIRPSSNSSTDKTILAISAQLQLADLIELRNVDNPFDFIYKLAYLKYEIAGNTKIHQAKLVDLTPYTYTGDMTYIEVAEELKQADKISLVFDIRDKRYIYQIK